MEDRKKDRKRKTPKAETQHQRQKKKTDQETAQKTRETDKEPKKKKRGGHVTAKGDRRVDKWTEETTGWKGGEEKSAQERTEKNRTRTKQ